LAPAGRVAARVPVLSPQLVVEVGGPERRADRQPPIDMSQLGGGEGVPERPRRIARGSADSELPPHRPAVEVELAGQGADAPAEAM
jgi:hypothetical protein